MRITVLISGGGTTLRNLLKVHSAGQLKVEFARVISNRADAGGLAIAKQHAIPSSVIPHQQFDSATDFSTAVWNEIEAAQTDLVVMGGFLRKLDIPDTFTNRVINIHPSLIPSFCGKGFYGNKVHQGVIDYGCKLTGCTVHFVDNQYDHGPIIAQSAVDVLPEDDAQTLAARVFEAECQLYPRVIQAIANGDIQVVGRKVRWNCSDE